MSAVLYPPRTRVCCATCGQKVEPMRGGRVRKHYVVTVNGKRMCAGRQSC